MSMNQYRGKEETDKVDFAKLSPEEQKKNSKEKMNPDQQNVNSNEDIAGEAKKKIDDERSKHIH